MEGLKGTGDSGDTFVGIKSSAAVDIQFKDGTLGPAGWFKKDMVGGELVELTVYYDTSDPGFTG